MLLNINMNIVFVDLQIVYFLQMGFPYELFMELYCYDKVKLYPFGLTNLGNRYGRVICPSHMPFNFSGLREGERRKERVLCFFSFL